MGDLPILGLSSPFCVRQKDTLAHFCHLRQLVVNPSKVKAMVFNTFKDAIFEFQLFYKGSLWRSPTITWGFYIFNLLV